MIVKTPSPIAAAKPFNSGAQLCSTASTKSHLGSQNRLVPGSTTPIDRAVMTATNEAYPECPVPALPLHALVKVAEVVGRKQLVGPVFVRQKHHSQVLRLARGVSFFALCERTQAKVVSIRMRESTNGHQG
jgi:hypothetical protein